MINDDRVATGGGFSDCSELTYQLEHFDLVAQIKRRRGFVEQPNGRALSDGRQQS